MLQVEPRKRANLDGLFQDEWVRQNAKYHKINPEGKRDGDLHESDTIHIDNDKYNTKINIDKYKKNGFGTNPSGHTKGALS